MTDDEIAGLSQPKAAPAKGLTDDDIAKLAAAPAAPQETAPPKTFLQEAGERAKGFLSNVATRPFDTLVVEPIKGVAQGVVDTGRAIGEEVTHPLRTLQGSPLAEAVGYSDPEAVARRQAVNREAIRGVYGNVPLLNLAIEHAGGQPEFSPEDEAKAPGARGLGGLAGLPVGSMLGESVGAAVKPVVSMAAKPMARVASAIGEKAEAGFAKRTNEAVFKNARPKDYDPASQVQRANPEEFKELIHSKDFAPVRKAAIKGKTEEALTRADALVDKVSSNRLKNYEEAASSYEATPAPVIDRMEKEAAHKAAAGAKDEAKAIQDAAREIRDEFATVDIERIREGDTAHDQALAKLKPYLPERKTLTKSEFQDAALELAKKNGGNKYGDVANDVHQAIESLPFKYDADASISLVQLRRAATRAQNTTKATLGSIAETEHFRIVKSVDEAINDGLNAHLDAAAATSPKAAAAVERIRHDNKVISMSISMRDALEMRAKRENLVKGDGNFMKKAEKAAHALHIGAAVAAPVVGGAAAPLLALPTAAYAGYKAKNLASDALARRSYAASHAGPMATPPPVATAPVLGAAAATVANSQRPSPDAQLSQLVRRADQGDPVANQKLSALTRNPIVSARVQALRRLNGNVK